VRNTFLKVELRNFYLIINGERNNLEQQFTVFLRRDIHISNPVKCISYPSVNTLHLDQNCAHVGYYAASNDNSLPTFRENLWDRQVFPEMSVRNYHFSLSNNPNECSSHLLRCGSLKSCSLSLHCKGRLFYTVQGNSFLLLWLSYKIHIFIQPVVKMFLPNFKTGGTKSYDCFLRGSSYMRVKTWLLYAMTNLHECVTHNVTTLTLLQHALNCSETHGNMK
jgi:hypothetical protein